MFKGYTVIEKSQRPFEIVSPFEPSGHQPQAIKALAEGVLEGRRDQVLLGVTGSGKTFTMAQVISKVQRPTLILAPNKTLAAQLYGEMKCFFPKNAVEYFVSYYDYYQPEAYVPSSGTYIEKESSINEQIERMRHSATRALLERKDVVVVASVSCIYGLGAVESYQGMAMELQVGQRVLQSEVLKQLVQMHYKRNDIGFKRGMFRVMGDRVDVFPSHYEDHAWSLSFFDEELESIHEIHALTGDRVTKLEKILVFPNSHYVAPGPTVFQAIQGIKEELKSRLQEFKAESRLVEAQRLQERVSFDLESLVHMGTCAGIENYSRYLTGRPSGAPPPTLFEYLPKDALFIVDESHVSVPQIRAMSAGDGVRKRTLAEYGFRLPSCVDNRPLHFDEWDRMRPSSIFVSATPAAWEITQAHGEVVEQLVRPTGLLDPVCQVRPTHNQIEDLMKALREVKKDEGRALVTTLTKKMAEDLCAYLEQAHFNVRYMHSDVDTLERIHLLQDLRKGVFDILIGINLLREGLDIPECQLVAILDADKQGYLRSKTALIQTMGRAARNLKGRVLLYADTMTPSLKEALEETHRRRNLQALYNEEHGIIPKATFSMAKTILEEEVLTPKVSEKKIESFVQRSDSIETLRMEMIKAAESLDFEKAAKLRDWILQLEKQ
ncbi:uvrABC system protein B [Holospora undulata HU1]|uniref:UvrABC system protein B n=1 Tax=Holospora undulata HU1 TaxID=1321371 RepID=A0A061JH83_9PROT|nr:uvrABC system protein B [Holospora undulata HU1]